MKNKWTYIIWWRSCIHVLKGLKIKGVFTEIWNFSCLIFLCSELNTTASAGDLSTEELQNITTTIVNDVQSGSTLLNLLNSTGVAIAEPPPDPEDPNWQAVLSEPNTGLQTLAQPNAMRLSNTIVPLHEGAPFSTQPKLQIFDSSVSVLKSRLCCFQYCRFLILCEFKDLWICHFVSNQNTRIQTRYRLISF